MTMVIFLTTAIKNVKSDQLHHDHFITIVTYDHSGQAPLWL